MRVLVVYASSRGGTQGLAEMVAEALIRHGVDADLGDARSVDDLAGYDAVIVGGALYHGRWHQDATWFVERNLDALRATHVWLFSSGPLDDSARSGALAPVAQVQALARQADVHGHMTFGGVYQPTSTGFLASLISWGKPGDFRDPQQVAEWAELIVNRLGERHDAAITLPDIEPEPGTAAGRVLRRLVTAGEDVDDSEDLGLDVLLD